MRPNQSSRYSGRGAGLTSVVRTYFGGVFVGVVAVAGITGCARDSDTARVQIQSLPAVAAKDKITDSFQVHSRGAQSQIAHSGISVAGQSTLLTIQRTALEKEFLLQGSLIGQTVAATGNALRSQVVAFRERGGKLYLMGANQGHSVTRDLPVNLVLAEFPVQFSDAQSITFDFGEGMRRILGVAGDWTASDMDGGEYDARPAFATVPTSVSYIDEAHFTARGELAIRQVVQLSESRPGVELRAPAEIRYLLSAYRPDPTYVPAKSPGFEQFGFFEIAPQLALDGSTVTLATRHHPDRPIVYAVSANTPPEFRQAIRDGVLYWNRAMGKNRISVVDAPAGVTAPDADYNLVQWVPWDQAGFAYADAQMDPRSGQILHAQIFLTSAFAHSGKLGAYSRLRELAPKKAKANSKHLTFKGFESHALCDFDLEQGLQSSLSALGAEPTEAQLLKISQDYVREVTAHEVGHTLGLRHNFAGSLAGNYALADRDAIVERYFRSGRAPEGVVTSSSVMEYQVFEESVIAGDQIARQITAGEYDRAAMSALYDGARFSLREAPPFCTDSHAEELADCNRFDLGKSPLEFAQMIDRQVWKKAARVLASQFIEAKAPEAGTEPRPLDTVLSVSTESLASYLMSGRAEIMASLTSRLPQLLIQRMFPAVGPANRKLVEKRTAEFLVQEVERAGGVTQFFPEVGTAQVVQLRSEFEELISSASFRRGKGRELQDYEFTDAEIAVMRNAGAQIFERLEAALVKTELKVLAGGELPEAAFSDALVPLLVGRATRALLMVEDSPVASVIEMKNADPKEGMPATRTVSTALPTFHYPVETRMMASSVLKGSGAKRATAIEWAYNQRKVLEERFSLEMRKILDGGTLSEVELKRATPAVIRWVLENRKVAATL